MPAIRERDGYLKADGTLRLVDWASYLGDEFTSKTHQFLRVPMQLDLYPAPMSHATSSGRALVSNGDLGADLIRVPAGEGFTPHTHPGDHLLIMVGGVGTVTYDGKIYETRAGQIYMIEGLVPHAVGAITDHIVLAVGAPHRPVDSTDRMEPVEYKNVLAPLGSLDCLICGVSAQYPRAPHDEGCPHCPCEVCVPVPE